MPGEVKMMKATPWFEKQNQEKPAEVNIRVNGGLELGNCWVCLSWPLMRSAAGML